MTQRRITVVFRSIIGEPATLTFERYLHPTVDTIGLEWKARMMELTVSQRQDLEELLTSFIESAS